MGKYMLGTGNQQASVNETLHFYHSKSLCSSNSWLIHVNILESELMKNNLQLTASKQNESYLTTMLYCFSLCSSTCDGTVLKQICQRKGNIEIWIISMLSFLKCTLFGKTWYGSRHISSGSNIGCQPKFINFQFINQYLINILCSGLWKRSQEVVFVLIICLDQNTFLQIQTHFVSETHATKFLSQLGTVGVSISCNSHNICQSKCHKRENL